MQSSSPVPKYNTITWRYVVLPRTSERSNARRAYVQSIVHSASLYVPLCMYAAALALTCISAQSGLAARTAYTVGTLLLRGRAVHLPWVIHSIALVVVACRSLLGWWLSSQMQADQAALDAVGDGRRRLTCRRAVIPACQCRKSWHALQTVCEWHSVRKGNACLPLCVSLLVNAQLLSGGLTPCRTVQLSMNTFSVSTLVGAKMRRRT